MSTPSTPPAGEPGRREVIPASAEHEADFRRTFELRTDLRADPYWQTAYEHAARYKLWSDELAAVGPALVRKDSAQPAVVPGPEQPTIRAALLRVAENVAKHLIQRSGWTPDDECFQVDLRESEAEIETLVAAEVLRRLAVIMPPERIQGSEIPPPTEADLRRDLASEYAALIAQFEASSGPSQAWQIARRMFLIRRCHHAETRLAAAESALAAERAAAGWQPADTLPNDGRCVLVLFEADGDETAVSRLEYYGDPVAVCAYSDKLKTTAHPTRFERDEVRCWAPIPLLAAPEPGR